jgi:hypothetical protein
MRAHPCENVTTDYQVSAMRGYGQSGEGDNPRGFHRWWLGTRNSWLLEQDRPELGKCAKAVVNLINLSTSKESPLLSMFHSFSPQLQLQVRIEGEVWSTFFSLSLPFQKK